MHPCKTTLAVLPNIAILTFKVFPFLEEKREPLKKQGDSIIREL